MTAVDLRLVDQSQHPAALERLAVQAMADGNVQAALRYADRRCRIPPIAEAHHFTLRAEAAYRSGDRASALLDLNRALELAPDDLAANRRMLSWAEGAPQERAAQALIRSEHDFAVLATAIELLRRRQRQRSLAAVTCTETTLTGWAAWSGKGPLKVTIANEAATETTTISLDPQHPLARCLGSAASFALPRAKSRLPQTARLTIARRNVHETRMVANDAAPADALQSRLRAKRMAPWDAANSKPDRAGRTARAAPSISVVVPVYGDYQATKTCLESLTDEIARTPRGCVIIVNDATPDRRIADLASSLAAKPHFKYLKLNDNIGFAAAVNRALEMVTDDDVLLLNADTILPSGAIARLAAAAHSAPDIGTVTPLSNNGEFTSLPLPFKPNPLGSFEQVAAIDRAAAAVADSNADYVVDLPNGIGFCLYVTRACLDACGSLSEDYRRGYFEDVELCLRARELGFRNVCATSVYIGHAGARSFGADKRSLVVHNLGVIETRFPSYRAECAGFVMADPLRKRRAAIERMLAGVNAGARLIATGKGAVRPVASARADDVRAAGAAALVIEASGGPAGQRISFTHPAQGIPQSLAFDLTLAAERDALSGYLADLRPSRLEIADPKNMPAVVLELPALRSVPIDLLLADAGLACRRGTFLTADGRICNGSDGRKQCDQCALPNGNCAKSLDSWRSHWRTVAHRAERVLVANHRAKAFALGCLLDDPALAPVIECGVVKTALRVAKANGEGTANAMGFIAIGDNLDEFRSLQSIARSLRRQSARLPIVVIGKTFDDLALMRIDGVFVVGHVSIEEHETVMRRYGVQALFVPLRQPLFGHPIIDAVVDRAPLPTAYFDWSMGKVPPRKRDLALDPRLGADDVAAALMQWIGE
jgi:O-antigen biosynthesis protein